MERVIYHRLTDWNHSFYGPNLNTSFEAGFAMSNRGELFVSGRVLDSKDRELFCSYALTDLDQSLSATYKTWNPAEELKDFIQDAENLAFTSEDSICFMAPYNDLCVEAKLAPTRPKGYCLSIHLHHFTIFGNYKWQDSGTISINMLCEEQEFIRFLRCLQSDLDILLSQRLEIC